MGRPFDHHSTVLVSDGVRCEDRLDGDHLLLEPPSKFGVPLVAFAHVVGDRVGGEWLQHAIDVELSVRFDKGGDWQWEFKRHR